MALSEQNDVKIQPLKADPSRKPHSFSAISILALLIMQIANLLRPGFQGERWTRDQPMPGPFPAPPPSQKKGPRNEVGSYD